MENDCENEIELIGRDALLYMVKAIQDEARTEREDYLLNRVVEAIKFLPKARVIARMTNLESMLEEIASTRIKSAFYKFHKRMTFIGDFAGEAETRKEAIEREIDWLKEEKKND